VADDPGLFEVIDIESSAKQRRCIPLCVRTVCGFRGGLGGPRDRRRSPCLAIREVLKRSEGSDEDHYANA
jgi:hypothetical protein